MIESEKLNENRQKKKGTLFLGHVTYWSFEV